MQALQDSGIALILSIQGLLHPTAGGIWTLLSYLGEENFYMLVIPAFYWCLHAGIGIRMLVFLLFSTTVNEVGKMLMHGPRPYWADARVLGLYPESSFGVPSGHAQNGLGFWLYLGVQLRREWGFGWLVPTAIGLGALISFSRMALGVHFPHDLVGGWLLACVLLWIFLSPGENLAARLARRLPTERVLVGAAAAAAILLVGLITATVAGTAGVPADWLANAARAHAALGKGHIVPAPYSIKTILSVTGTVLGLGIGLPLAARYAPFAVTGTVAVRSARFVVGIITLFLVQFGLSVLLPKEGAAGYEIMRVFRYCMVGMWAVLGAPMLFLRLGLANAASHVQER